MEYLVPIGAGVGLWWWLKKKPITAEEWAISHEHRIELAKRKGIYWEEGAGGYVGGFGWHHRASDTWMPSESYMWGDPTRWHLEVEWINQF